MYNAFNKSELDKYIKSNSVQFISKQKFSIFSLFRKSSA